VKIAVFDDDRVGLVEEDLIYDVTAAVPDAGPEFPRVYMSRLIAQWDRRKADIEKARREARARPLSEVTLRAPNPFPLHVVVHGVDRPGLLSDVAHAVADMRINILSARACSRRDGIGTIDMVIEVRSLDQFAELRRKLERVRDVFAVERVGGHGG